MRPAVRRTIITLLALTVVATTTAPTAGRQTVDVRTTRLAALGKVWLAVKFAHPRVALTDRDWDAVLTSAVPAVQGATDERSFQAAVASMLKTLDDPVTRVQAASESEGPRSGGGPPGRPAFVTLPGGALLIDVRAPGALGDVLALRAAIAENLATIAKAERLVVDVRGTLRGGFNIYAAMDALNEILVSAPIALPASRYVRHSGYRPQAGGASFYSSDVVTEAAIVQKPRDGIAPSTSSGQAPRRVAFVVDRSALVTPLALALQVKGLGAVVSVGEPPETPVRTIWIPLGGGASASIRVTDLTVAGRRIELNADAVLATGEPDERVHARAAELIARQRPVIAGIEDLSPVWQPELTYADVPYPSEPRRLLAVYRLWGVIDSFFPYKHLTDRPWDEALTTFIPRALTAKDALEYPRTVAAMAAMTEDSHVRVTGSAALTRYLGEIAPPVYVRYVEGRPIVTRIVDEQAAPGLIVGDEILSVDGEDATAKARRIEQCISFSTRASRNGIVAARLLSGDFGSLARVTVRGADGRPRDVEIKRPLKAAPATQRSGDAVRILEGNIGYADLERLEVAQVASMFDRFRETAAIIFDMRGYPHGTAWAIAPRINRKKAAAAAQFFRPMMSAGSTDDRLSFMQDLPPTTTWIYERPTAMLIDERAISQSEHTGLFFKAANDTTFVGGPTSGANGDVTSMTLPGGLRVSFTGHDVRWPDGRQLQRVGLVPDVAAAPTIAGIRAGRDEVLEAAMAFLRKTASSSQLPAPSRRF